MTVEDRDTRMRIAAFDHVRRLSEAHGLLTRNLLSKGFVFEGGRIPLVNPQRGIFKPRQMRHLLSITTVYPKTGEPGSGTKISGRSIGKSSRARKPWTMRFMGQDPEAADNRWLRDAFENQVPVIYFLGVSPGRYQAIVPTYISGWDGFALKSSLTFGNPYQERFEVPVNETERRYALRMVKDRLHQNTFREAVLHAYRGRCAITGLPETRLLDAAHIISDRDEALGQPVVPNGTIPVQDPSRPPSTPT